MEQDIAVNLASAVRARYDDYVNDLRALTSIDCPTSHKQGLDEVAEYIDRVLRRAGADARILRNSSAGNDVIGAVEGRGQKRITLLCHTDTVYPVGTVAKRPFRIEDNHALAPGVCDMKGGLLGAVYSVLALGDVGFDDFASITVLCNSDEESSPRHSVDLIEETARASDCVLTMEPARINGDIVSARKGVLVYKVTFFGREAHAGVNPDLGRNSIVALADRLTEVWKLNGKLPGLNVNPGLIRGGSAVNTVPGEATCEIDVRISQSDHMAAFDDMLRGALKGSIIGDVTFEVIQEHTMPPLEKTKASERLVSLAQQAAEELGFTVNETATGGASDGAHAAATGTPVLDGLGPIGGYAHSEREFLDLHSVVPRIAMLARLITLV